MKFLREIVALINKFQVAFNQAAFFFLSFIAIAINNQGSRNLNHIHLLVSDSYRSVDRKVYF